MDRLSLKKEFQPCPTLEFNQSQILVRKAMDYIESNYANNISLNIVANHVHLSPAYLSRIFTKKTGSGLTEYLTQERLKKAKNQLLKSTETIDRLMNLSSGLEKTSIALRENPFRGLHDIAQDSSPSG